MISDKSVAYLNSMINLVENGPLNEFIDFAKNYNIFQPNGGSFYTMMCTKIKERLDREGLSYDTVRPE